MNFKKYIQITTVLGAFFALVFIKNLFGDSHEGGGPVVINPTTFVALPTTTPAVSQHVLPTPRASQYKDGTFTGSVADAFYGNVQIQVVVTGGKVTKVTFLQYPNDQRTSQSINSQAMPLLQSEAISAQSERVSGVSGASATSQAFVRSLGNALRQARAV